METHNQMPGENDPGRERGGNFFVEGEINASPYREGPFPTKEAAEVRAREFGGDNEPRPGFWSGQPTWGDEYATTFAHVVQKTDKEAKEIKEMAELKPVEGGGFIKKEAVRYTDELKKEAGMTNREREIIMEERSFLAKVFRKGKLDNVSYIDLAHEETMKEDYARASRGRTALVQDISRDLGVSEEVAQGFLDKADEIMTGVPSGLEVGEEGGLSRLQQKTKQRLGGALWSYKTGDPVDAVMRLPSSNRIERDNALIQHLADNAGEELLAKLRKLYQSAPSVTDNLEDPDWSEQAGRNSLYWRENVVPVLIEILKKSDMF